MPRCRTPILAPRECSELDAMWGVNPGRCICSAFEMPKELLRLPRSVHLLASGPRFTSTMDIVKCFDLSNLQND
jgi:hypothetical protein